MDISHTSFIDPSAQLGQRVKIGPGAVIGPNVVVGDDCKIGANVVIERDTTIGQRNRIHPFASIGGDPQDLSYHGETTRLVMGDDNIVREFCTINRGSTREQGLTQIGNKNCFLAYSHVAHDCVIGNEILFVNNATLAGHVRVDDYVILGAFTAVHQFCHVGSYSFLSQATEISKDVPPYMLVRGIPGVPCGLNVVGLKRRGFNQETISYLKEAYRTLYNRGIKFQDALSQLAVLAQTEPAVQNMLDFIHASKRGITRKSHDEISDLE